MVEAKVIGVIALKIELPTFGRTLRDSGTSPLAEGRRGFDFVASPWRVGKSQVTATTRHEPPVLQRKDSSKRPAVTTRQFTTINLTPNQVRTIVLDSLEPLSRHRVLLCAWHALEYGNYPRKTRRVQ